ncbi:MAG: cysteine--tRNA ligase [Magnetovibrio sp.]|nr:cysteine--tRNA ligase [Magnetovibrio sp.]|tara:strand:+ start:678 stop:2015 length:1338 start_codon:yes stop_codon:yes gene_type:complete
MLMIHDTLSRSKVKFTPIDEEHIRIYVCGPTVYDYAHIGNARPAVIFDVLVCLLRQLYSRVTYVRNITDVDDKINARALETGKGISEITASTTKFFHNDMKALGVEKPDVEPRATDHISDMIELIEVLIEKNHAYVVDGHVLFSVTSMKNYGNLSKLDKREIVAGARIDVAPYKSDPSDFVLWKPSTSNVPGWDSPWGRGRPGWHIECSAMSRKHLGEAFDIHGGGQDLIFPHHENEIAQSTCAFGEGMFAKYWMHNGYLMSEGEKMSKSLGNFYTVNELLNEFPGESIRLALLQTHYRQPLDFTKDNILEARRSLDRWYRMVDKIEVTSGPPESVRAALCDDMNTPQALAEIHKFARIGDTESLLAGAQFLGLVKQDPEEWFKWASIGSEECFPTDTAIEALINERSKARQEKNFARSDAIRDELAAQGIILEDGSGGTTWRRG